MALIILVLTPDWIQAQRSSQYSFAQRLAHRCTLLRAAFRACSFFPSRRSCLQPTLSSFLLLLEPLSLYAPQTSLRFWFLLAEVGHGCTMNCIPEVIPSFLIASYREAGERFLKHSYELLHFLCIAGLANVNASMRSFCDIYCFKGPTVIFFGRRGWGGGGEKSGKKLFAKGKKLKYIVCRHKKKKIKSLQTSR